jgi:hypothetical protein
MAEVYSFLECTLKKVGTASGDTTETAMGAYAEGITVTLTRDLGERFDTEGVRQRRIVLKKQAQMDIAKFFGTDDYLFDGNDIKLYMQNSTGTQTWTLSKAYWSNKGWMCTDAVRQNVTIVGNDFTLA